MKLSALLLLTSLAAASASAQQAPDPETVLWQRMWALHAARCTTRVHDVAATLPGARRQRWVEHELRALPGDANTHVPPVRARRPLGKAAAPSATINVSYTNFPDEARAAFQFAADLWETHVRSDVTINVAATWRPLEERVLGSAGATFIESDESFLPRANTWYAIALAEALAGSNLTGADADIAASFNSSFSSWYYGTDGKTPSGKYDLATVVLHEIGHGLGFFDSFGYDDGDDSNGDECPNAPADYGCVGIQNRPVIFDRFLRDRAGNPLLDAARYPSPSLVLGNALRDSVRFDAPAIRAITGDFPIDLYAPANFEPGSSIAHLDEAAYPAGDPNSLMTPFLKAAESNFSPGPVTCALFRDLGWGMGPDCEVLLGADVLQFTASEAKGDVAFNFLLSTTTDAVRIEIEQQYFTDAPVVVASIPVVAGENVTRQLSDLAPGRYRFRLRIVNADGSRVAGPEAEVTVALTSDYLLSDVYPNPFRDAVTVTLQVRRRQDVKARLYDATGRLVANLYNDAVLANTRQTFRIDGGALAAGLYLLRVESDEFSETRLLVHVR